MTAKTHATRQKKLYKMRLDVTSSQKKKSKIKKEVSTDADDTVQRGYSGHSGRSDGVSWTLVHGKIVGFQGYGQAQDSPNV